ncbi:MAG: amidohydrolase family protein, partial [Candidatus Dormibacteraceae bacterium]
MRIDVHNHAFPAAVIDLVSRDDSFGVRVSDGKVVGINADHELFDTLHDPRAKIRELESHGLEAAVISVAPRLFSYQLEIEPATVLCQAVNSGLRAMADHDPSRLRWMGAVPLQSVTASTQMLEALARDGASGVEIGTTIAGRPLDAPEMEPFWATVERLRLPVFIHSAHVVKHPSFNEYYLSNAIGNPLETTIAAERLVASGVL